MNDEVMRGFAQRDLARKLGERNTRSAVGSRSRQRKARSSSALPTNHRWPTAHRPPATALFEGAQADALYRATPSAATRLPSHSSHRRTRPPRVSSSERLRQESRWDCDGLRGSPSKCAYRLCLRSDDGAERGVLGGIDRLIYDRFERGIGRHEFQASLPEFVTDDRRR